MEKKRFPQTMNEILIQALATRKQKTTSSHDEKEPATDFIRFLVQVQASKI